MHRGVGEKMNRYDRLNRDLSALCYPAGVFPDEAQGTTTECLVVSLIPRLTRSSREPALFQISMAARLHRNSRYGRREAEDSWNRNIADRDYMLHYKNDNNRVDAAAEFRLKLC